MERPLIISLIMGMFMVLSGALTVLMTPSVMSADPKLDLDAIIPSEFNDWKVDLSVVPLLVNPDEERTVNKIYSQALSRTYINKIGERVMLSIAYGSDQKKDLQVHRPEICYRTAGFEIGRMTKTFVDTTLGQIPVMRLVAKQGSRNEPITYWIRVGDTLARGWFEQKLAAFNYGITGKVPDGLLFRVSTISNDEQDSYRVQQTFLADLLQAMRSDDRHWLVGKMLL